MEVSAGQEMTEIVKVPSPQLHEFGVNEKMNEPEGLLLLRAKIIFLVKFNGGDWDKDMVNETAKIAYQEMNWMTVAEVKYFINRIASGKYPHHKNFIPSTFMEHLNSYINETLSTRGAVNAYDWKNNRVPDELFEVPANPATGEVKEVDPDVLKKVMRDMAKQFKEMERIKKEEDEQARAARWKRMKEERNRQIIEVVEHNAEQGIAPDKYMMKSYFEARQRLSENKS